MCDYTLHKLKKLFENVEIVGFSISEKNDIIKAVEKGIKRELLFKRKIGKYHSLYVCPNCKKTMYKTGCENDYPLRCSHCGQRLSWKSFRNEENSERKAIAKILMESEEKLDVSTK